tara:strand:+ start:9744 stop:10487 length:744 start_codon:yes stop_codon:yes gene_type:complete
MENNMGIEHSVYVITDASETSELKIVETSQMPNGDGFVTLFSSVGIQVRPIYNERPNPNALGGSRVAIPLHTLLFALKRDIYHWEESVVEQTWEDEFKRQEVEGKGKLLASLFDKHTKKTGFTRHVVDVALREMGRSSNPYNDMVTVFGYAKGHADDVQNIDSAMRMAIPELHPSDYTEEVSKLIKLVNGAEEYFSRQNDAVKEVIHFVSSLSEREALAATLMLIHGIDQEQCQWLAHRSGFTNMKA